MRAMIPHVQGVIIQLCQEVIVRLILAAQPLLHQRLKPRRLLRFWRLGHAGTLASTPAPAPAPAAPAPPPPTITRATLPVPPHQRRELVERFVEAFPGRAARSHETIRHALGDALPPGSGGGASAVPPIPSSGTHSLGQLSRKRVSTSSGAMRRGRGKSCLFASTRSAHVRSSSSSINNSTSAQASPNRSRSLESMK